MSGAGEALRVSVVIPAYNAAATIERAIESVLAQTRPVAEIIVVDNASTDATAAIVKKYSSVRYEYQDQPGPAATRNCGILRATGDWIAFLDADDEWLPAKQEYQTALLSRHPELVWTTANFFYQLKYQRQPATDIETAQQFLAGGDLWENYLQAFLRRAGGWTGTMLIHKTMLLEAGLFRLDMPPWEDLDLWWRIAYRNPRCGYTSEPLAVYHMDTPGSLSSRPLPLSFVAHFVGQHLSLAAEHQQTDFLQPAVRKMMIDWMRAALFDARIKDIRVCLRQFGGLVGIRWVVGMWLLTIWPSLTRRGCQWLSRWVQTLGLRREMGHPVKRAEDKT